MNGYLALSLCLVFSIPVILIGAIIEDAFALNYSNSSPTIKRVASNNPSSGTCVGRTYVTADTTGDINYGITNFCSIPTFEFDVTSIDDSAMISSATITYDIDSTDLTGNCTVRELDTQPANGQTTYNESLSGTKIATSDNGCQSTGNTKTFTINTAGLSDMQTKIQSGQNWYAFSFFMDDPSSPNTKFATTSDFQLDITYSIATNVPDAITDLNYTSITHSTVDLDWTEPSVNASHPITGYHVLYTTPWGDPTTIVTNDTGTTDTDVQVAGLAQLTNYTFYVQGWNDQGKNGTKVNLLNVTTLEDFSSTNFTVGSFDVNATNNEIIQIFFERQDINSTSLNLLVTYPNSYDLNCDFDYQFANTNQTYSSVAGIPVTTNAKQATFQFNGVNNEIIDVYCWDGNNANNDGTYIITQTDFPLLQQIEAFRSGDYGTEGFIGALDFITFIVIIISMIGLNRVNESVGAIFNIAFLGALASFGIIELPTILFGAIILVVMLVITSTRKT